MAEEWQSPSLGIYRIWDTGTQSHCRRIINAQTLLPLIPEMSLDLETQQWAEQYGSAVNTQLNQEHESHWQITVWSVIISELGKCLSLKESIPGGKRAVFLETPRWVIYFKWMEGLFILAPTWIQWTVYLHKARKCYHFFKSICPFEQLYLEAFSGKFTSQAKSSTQETISNPAFSTSVYIAYYMFPNFST